MFLNQFYCLSMIACMFYILTFHRNLQRVKFLHMCDVPQILVDECQPILANLDKSVTDDIISCPLRILNYPEVVDKLKKSISRLSVSL